MKSGKKSKQTVFLTVQKSNNKLPTQKTTNPISSTLNATSSEHRKLLQYRDYLISLRKMDLGSLIQRNNCRKKEQVHKTEKDHAPKLSQTQQLKNIQQTDSSEFRQQQESRFTNPTARKQMQSDKKLQANSITNPQTFDEKIQRLSVEGQIENKPILLQIDIKDKAKQPNKNSFTLCLKQNLQDDDLYCDETMDDLMNPFKPSTPRLLHISNFQVHNQNRNLSTHRSSRRDFSMPSIEERNLSEQSQGSFPINDKSCYRSVPNNDNQRKYNSCTHTTSANPQITPDLKEKSKKNSIIQIQVTSRSRTRLQTSKNFDKENLVSTKDVNTDSGNKSARQRIHQNVTTNPFNFKLETKMDKQQQKLSLNVSQIVKRINSRESKSSMSDRSYKKKLQSSQVNKNSGKKDFYDESYGSQIKERRLQMNFDSSKILAGKNQIQSQQQTKRKSFKTQVRQFRQKHYLMMKLCA